MTEEEKREEIKRTRKLIERFCDFKCAVSKGDVVCINCVRILDFQTGLAEGRKENAELKAQIEKMKCCENCNLHKKGKCTEDAMFYARTRNYCDKWELAECQKKN